MTAGPYTVYEQFEEDPRYEDERGTWRYFVDHRVDGPVSEHRWYSSAAREAERLNVQAARRSA